MKLEIRPMTQSIACSTCNAYISPRVLATRWKTWSHQRWFSLPGVLTLSIRSASNITMAVALQFLSGFFLCLGYLHLLPLFLFHGESLRYPGLVFPSQPLFQAISPILGRFFAHLLKSALILGPCLLVQTRDWISILTVPIESVRH